MGQEQSLPIDDSVPCQTLKARSVDAVAKCILSGHAKKIVVMVGAGISTSAGIPDFRSPDTGLYANLGQFKLPYAEAIFEINFFRVDPLPFYTFAHELYPGKYRPTISHSFIRLLSDKGLLLKLFTQNIDCLDIEAGVPKDKIIEAHGSFARQSCIDCHTSYPDDLMRKAIDTREVPHCLTPQCNGLVKPDIVFFGEQLPEDFFRNRDLPAQADLCLVMGTSLSVQPFASLPGLCKDHIPRMLINLERVGGLGSRADDVLMLGDCDTGVRKFASALGWEEELESLWKATQSESHNRSTSETSPPKSKNEKLYDEIADLTKEVDKSLRLSADHDRSTRDQLNECMKQKHEEPKSSLEPATEKHHVGDDSERESIGDYIGTLSGRQNVNTKLPPSGKSPEDKGKDRSATASATDDKSREPSL